MFTQYSFITEAFLHDYWKNTAAEFNYLYSSQNLNDLLTRAKQDGFIFHYKSKTNHGKISSMYYVNPHKTKLIRISNHWSESNIKGVKECDYIGNCYWVLKGNPKEKLDGCWQAGICDLIRIHHI